MLKRENYHIKMCFLFLVWQQCASVKKRNRPTDQPASNPTPLTGVGAKPRCRWRASPDWARSLTQEEALRNCLFFSPLLSQKPFESLTHPVQGHPSPPPHPLSFPGGFHNLFAPHLQRGAAGLHFTSPPEPQMRKVCSIGTKKRRKKARALTWEKSWNDKKKGLLLSTQLTWINVSAFPPLPALNHRLSCRQPRTRLLTPRDTLRLNLSGRPFRPLHWGAECEWVWSHFYSISFQVGYSLCVWAAELDSKKSALVLLIKEKS